MGVPEAAPDETPNRTDLARARRAQHEDGGQHRLLLRGPPRRLQQVAEGLDVPRDVPPAPQRGAQGLLARAVEHDGDAVERAWYRQRWGV